MSANEIHDDPEAIERDIRLTQENMSRTVDKLGDQFTMRNLFNSLLDKADENNVDARYLIDGARRNPVALGLIAAGAIWLVSDKESKFPSLPSRKSGGSDGADFTGQDVHHRDYVSHMSSFETREGEDQAAYRRRRDLHRANFLMCEQRADEDDHSFRQRLDELTEKFRDKRRAWSDSASQSGTAASQTVQDAAQRASTRAVDFYGANPLVGGMLAAAVGAALGSALPVSRQEQEKLGSAGQKARDLVSDGAEQLTSAVREKKDELVDRADENLRPDGGQQAQPVAVTPADAQAPANAAAWRP